MRHDEYQAGWKPKMTRGVDRVRAYLSSRGIDAKVVEFETSTRNSQLAADALGCTVGEIAKTVVFTAEKTVVVVLSGEKRVDTGKLARLVGSRTRIASADEVKRLTGYAAGGVPPFPHTDGIVVYPDSSLTKYSRVWAAAGEHNAVVQISVVDLLRLLGTAAVDVTS